MSFAGIDCKSSEPCSKSLSRRSGRPQMLHSQGFYSKSCVNSLFKKGGGEGEGLLWKQSVDALTKSLSRVGRWSADVPPLRQSDVSYVVSVVLNALCPPAPPGQLAAVNAKLNAADARANSLTFTGSRDIRNTTRLSNQLYRIAFLGDHSSSRHACTHTT